MNAKICINAQGLKVIMVVLHVWIIRIYVATIEVHRKERGGGGGGGKR